MSRLPRMLLSIENKELTPGNFGLEVVDGQLVVPPALMQALGRFQISFGDHLLAVLQGNDLLLRGELGWDQADIQTARTALVGKFGVGIVL